jgi:ubiquinone/menaquinone biosynthesis C-methylase UbiE
MATTGTRRRTHPPHPHYTPPPPSSSSSSSSRRLPLLHANINPTTRNSSNERRLSGGFGQWLLERALDSPLWEHVLVPQARQKIVQTAKANGIAWDECKAWLKSQDGPWKNDDNNHDDDAFLHSAAISMSDIPDYYKKAPYHAYSKGNLCWEAALEVEIASKAVGARNFPAFGRNGEEAFRDSFGVALDEMTASITSTSIGAAAAAQNEFIMVDLGCGTGMSTRWLAQRYSQATKILGMDLSLYFIQVGKRLLELAPRQRQEDVHDDIQQQQQQQKQQEQQGTWVSTIQPDDRIEYVWGNAANTGLPDNYCHVVNLQFVAHELPVAVTCDIIREAHRILKEPNDNNHNVGGQLWFCEMDFESPGYAAQRANPLLFSLIRATEPYLDEYANHAAEIRTCLQEIFDEVIITAATGRHFAICATKKKLQRAAVPHEELNDKDLSSSSNDNDTSGGKQKSRRMGTLRDLRFDQHGVYRVEDTHLKVWENKG